MEEIEEVERTFIDQLQDPERDPAKLQQDVLAGNYVDGVDLSKTVRLSKDMRTFIARYGKDKYILRTLVDSYSQAQDFRIVAENRLRPTNQGYDSAHDEHLWFLRSNAVFGRNQETFNQKLLDVAIRDIPICNWMTSIKGIGPVFAAKLYVYLDVTKAPYATNFLSYCGLNDNNNPWLGKVKSKDLVKKLLAERDDSFVILNNKLELAFGDKYPKFLSEMKKSIKSIVTAYNLKPIEKFSGSNNPMVTDKPAIIEDFIATYNNYLQEEVLSIFRERAGDFLGTRNIDKLLYMAADHVLYEFLMTLQYPTFVGDVIYIKAAVETTRNVTNIRTGVITTILSQYNTKSKEIKYSVPTSEDLISYLSKPPYNLELKKVMYQIGDLFIRNRNRGSMYGNIYYQRYLQETEMNSRFAYREQAKQLLEMKDWSAHKDIYDILTQGKLTDAHLKVRARRYAVKLFISHVHEAMYYDKYHKKPPMPYIIDIGGHHDYIAPETDYHDYL